jgi:glycerophosphoryl diester phosphodiesterase
MLLAVAAVAARAAIPLPQAHSHNDYEHTRPLVDALSHGFWSVEADIWLTNGQLLVAHDFDKVAPEKTLEKLYLQPLRSHLSTNADAVRRIGPMTLLIDLKSDSTNTWLALRDVLARYTNILTRFEQGRTITNALTVIISGNRATPLFAADPVRYAAVDGRLPDLDTNPPPELMPLVSDNWTKYFKWRGQGSLPAEERDRLRALVGKAHAQGRRIRLWAAPDSPAAWRELREAGVDLINTDRLADLAAFLRNP